MKIKLARRARIVLFSDLQIEHSPYLYVQTSLGHDDLTGCCHCGIEYLVLFATILLLTTPFRTKHLWSFVSRLDVRIDVELAESRKFQIDDGSMSLDQFGTSRAELKRVSLVQGCIDACA